TPFGPRRRRRPPGPSIRGRRHDERLIHGLFIHEPRVPEGPATVLDAACALPVSGRQVPSGSVPTRRALPDDPIDMAADHWRAHGWGDAAPGMAVLTS